MKKNSVLWCDSTGRHCRFVSVDASDAAVADVLRTAAALHKTGVAKWAIYFGDKGAPTKQWDISPEQAKVIAGMYKPLNQAYTQGTALATQNSNRQKMVEGKQALQLVKPHKSGRG